MRICFFADARNVHVHRLSAGLSGRGHAVHVVTHKPAEIPSATVERFRVPNAGLKMPFRWHGRWAAYLKGFLRRFDVVVVYFLEDWGFTPDILTSGCLVASPRGSDVVAPPGEDAPTPELVARRVQLLRHATLVGVAGPSFARIVADYASLPVESLATLPLGVDLRQFTPREDVRPGAPHGFRIGFFKGFRPVYGARTLVEAVPPVRSAFPSAVFEFLGDGPDLEGCRRLAASLNEADSTRWMARRPHHQVPAWLRECDVTVMPSRCESFGLAALESSAAGIPVVASRVGGLIDTVQHGHTGLLVPPDCPQRLAEAILMLLQDEPLRRRLGSQGRSWVRDHYEWHKVLGQWEAAFEQARDRVFVQV
jgi:glycosyltransferase involved in cell wall biosynthesis